MAEDRTVDVGMPAHGRPLFLAEAIRSALGQSHEDLRVVVLDDTQDGEIEAVVRRAAGEDPRLTYLRAEPMSPMRAMTELIGSGDAPYFAFLHDDDRWDTDFLARRLSFLDEHPGCGFVFSGHVDIDDRGEVIARTPAPFPEGVVPREVLIPELLQRSAIGVMHSVLCRRSTLERAGPRLDESVPRLFDWELWLRVALTGPAGCLAAQDVAYRAHPEQMSGGHGRGRDVAALLRHADELVAERAPELGLDPTRRARRDASVALSVAFDALEEGDAAAARAAARESLRIDRHTALRDRRLPAIVLGSMLGGPGRAAVLRLRAGLYRRSHRRRMRGEHARPDPEG